MEDDKEEIERKTSKYDPKLLPWSIKRKLPESAYFNDGKRLVDFVLAFKPGAGGKKKAEWAKFRSNFEAEMARQNLELEYEDKELSQDGQTAFIKIHATWDALSRQAEYKNLQKPIMISDLNPKLDYSTKLLDWLFGEDKNPCRLQPELRPDDTEFFTDAFERDREEVFLIGEDRSLFFTGAERVRLTWDTICSIAISLEFKRPKKGVAMTLRRRKIAAAADDQSDDVEQQRTVTKTANIQWLLRDGVYSAAFPLHDGQCEDDDDENQYEDVPVNQWSMRKYLYESWARPSQWKRFQPLNIIRDYYGEKVGIYFAWLGFYTQMLFLPSILGIVVLAFGIYRALNTSPAADEICTENPISNRTICRSCPDTACEFTQLKDHCLLLRVNRVFDNGTGALFAILMAIWAVVFQSMWRRYQSELCFRWDVTEHELVEEQIRPEYVIAVTETRISPITNQPEVYLPKRSKAAKFATSLTVASIFVALVISLVAAVMIYKVASALFWKQLFRGTILDIKLLDPRLVGSVTASAINGCFIALMNKVYGYVAWRLTVNEIPRTTEEFEKSYVYKVFGFQFVNFYGPLFYLAFVRGQLMDPPNEQPRFRDRCEPSGCLLDVTIMLFVVMTGKQAANNFIELGVPWIMKWLRTRTHVKPTEDNKYTQWEKDADLETEEPVPLFSDYLEMVIQYGFITMFVAAFPLAPLFALINNVMEIRVDAYKDLMQYRRFIPVRARNIGPWSHLMIIVTKVAILTNGLMIAFTTDYIDKLMYNHFYQGTSETQATTYVDFRLSPFLTEDWCIKPTPTAKLNTLFTRLGENCSVMMDNHKICYFRDYSIREANGEYHRTKIWWHVMVAKLAFVFIFEHFIVVLQGLLQYLIPEVPDHVNLRIKRESFLQRQSFMKAELKKSEEKEATAREDAKKQE